MVDLFFHQTPEYRAVEARTTLFETFARFGDAFKDVPDEELEREIASAQTEVRAQMRAERVARGEG